MTDNSDNPINPDHPLDADKLPIRWDGNRATIPGILDEMNKWSVRTGNHKLLIQKRAVLFKGALYLDSVDAVKFHNGDFSDSYEKYSVSKMCPPTPARIVKFDASPNGKTFKTYKDEKEVVSDDDKRAYRVSPEAVEVDDSKYLTAWSHVLEGTTQCEDLLEAANGSGYDLVQILLDEASKATGRDKTLVTTRFSAIKDRGVVGRLTIVSWKAFIKDYRIAKRHLDAATKAGLDAQELEMVATVAYSDEKVGDKYDLKTTATPPQTFKEAAEILEATLRDMDRNEEIQQAKNGQPDGSGTRDKMALVVDKLVEAQEKNAKTLEALAASRQPVADPEKNKKKKKKKAAEPETEQKKVQPPRDDDGRIIKWVPGMDPCKCGGSHLYRDCPEESGTAGVAALEPHAPGTTTSESLHSQLCEIEEFLNSAEPAVVQESCVTENHKDGAKCAIMYPLRFLRNVTHKVTDTALSAFLATLAFGRTVLKSSVAFLLLLLLCASSVTFAAGTAGAGGLAVHHGLAALLPEAVAPPPVDASLSLFYPVNSSLPDPWLPCYSAFSVSGVAGSEPTDPGWLAEAGPSGASPPNPGVDPPPWASQVSAFLANIVNSIRTASIWAAAHFRTPGLGLDGIGAFVAAAVAFHRSWVTAWLLASLAWIACVASFGAVVLTVSAAVYTAVLPLATAGRSVRWASKIIRRTPLAIRIAAVLLFAWATRPSVGPCDHAAAAAATIPCVDLPAPAQQWLPDAAALPGFTHESRVAKARHVRVPHRCLVSENRSAAPSAAAADSAFTPATAIAGAIRGIFAAVDSGCTGSLTWNKNWLINVKPCSETFRAANGVVTKCEGIGDMPVIARLGDGTLARFTIRNVRLVPSFRYTLLSVSQIWNEQKILAEFGDTNALSLAKTGNIVAFDPAERLPTVRLSSAVGIPDSVASGPSQVALPAEGRSSLTLGWHRVGSTAHVTRMPAARAAELIHRRGHAGIDKIRSAAHTCSDAPRSLASATGVSCDACALAGIKKAAHGGTLSAPAPEPGTLHIDLKELVLSTGGYRYVVFAIDEYTRYIFIEFIKQKSEADAAVERCIAAFNANVATPVDSDGNALPRPTVRRVHSDREGKLMSHTFRAFCASESIHHTVSPSHDHDLNPIAERIIGLIAERATAIRSHADASASLWPYIIAYAVDWHNALVTATGSSSADAQISPHQRLTKRPAPIMDLATFGCMAVVLKPPTHQHKPSLSERGWVGKFLGRSRYSKGSYDVMVDGQIVSSSSVLVDEERFPWSGPERRHRPLSSISHAAGQPQQQPLVPAAGAAGSLASAPSTFAATSDLRFLNLFSGPYGRADGLSAAITQNGWADVEQIDNDGEKGGGWGHDLLNDEFYSKLLAKAAAGRYDAMMVAFPCSTFSVTRFFDASASGSDQGPPILRTKEFPDGLPLDRIDARYHRELRTANELLKRTVNLAIAAHGSSKRTTIVLENPVDRSETGFVGYDAQFADHGSVFATSDFKRLAAAVGLSRSTFAYCRLDSPYQKYTTLQYTSDAKGLLDALNGPEFKCNHPRGSHSKRAGGRDAEGGFTSSEAAAYPVKLCWVLARAFTLARTGSPDPVAAAPTAAPPRASRQTVQGEAPDADSREAWWQGQPTPPAGGLGSGPGSPPASAGTPPGSVDLGSAAGSPQFSPMRAMDISTPLGANRVTRKPTKPSFDQAAYDKALNAGGDFNARAGAKAKPPKAPALPAVTESPSGVDDGYVPFAAAVADTVARAAESFLGSASPRPTASPGGVRPDRSLMADEMESLVASVVYSAAHDLAADDHKGELLPVTPWEVVSTPRLPALLAASVRLPGGRRAVEFDAALPDGGVAPESFFALLACCHSALRADSPDAPSTHAEAMARGEVWVQAERKELDNHANNGSWTTIARSAVPAGRRLHKMLWVYKVKRDGTCKARLCVQGSSLEAGIDFDQVFSAALRYSSARSLFALAARRRCGVRSIDLVAAYLQGSFLDGERIYCHLPPGHVEYDSKGRPLVARIEKPIYGIQQAGRRLQRQLFAWLRDQGFKSLDDSDPCVFTRTHADGEELTIGLYVDNLQIVHSVTLDANGRGPKGCAYNAFVDALSRDWEVVDEGPMDDLLGIEVEHLADGSIKLHQEKYIRKIVERFLPGGVSNRVQRNTLPYSSSFLENVNAALAQETTEYPHLVREMQERIGCLMYACTSTRPDIAYPVHKLCQCLTKPTPEVLAETDHILAYLSRHATVGLTYSSGYEKLKGYSDASWETRHSTSGWVVLWQSAAVQWGSHKQKSVALSTCEAEIIALSEAAKDIVYTRKFLSGLGVDVKEPTELFSDSQSGIDVAYNPEHHGRMKHVLRRHFFVRDMVEEFELTVPFVRSEDQIADFLTKPFKSSSAPAFFAMRALVMNEPARPAAPAAAPAPVGSAADGGTSNRGGASECGAVSRRGTAHMDKYEHAVHVQPAAAKPRARPAR